jgi:predicted amidohydrolase
VRPDGTYATVPLEKETIVLKVLQSAAKPVDVDDPGPTISENLECFLVLARKACTEGDKPDLLLSHEFPLTGWFAADRAGKLGASIEIPGPETEALGALAREFDTYLIFGSYVRDPDWPGHILSLTTVIDRQGQVLAKVWKPRNIKRFFSGFEITTTTVEAVQDRFRARYGQDAELPVIRTEFGNIAVSTAQLDPLIYHALALKGAELILRTSVLFAESDVVNTARVNRLYSAMGNIAMDMPEGSPASGGGSLIVAPDGTVLAKGPTGGAESIVAARIPIAEFRRNRRLPQLSVALTRPYLRDYVEEIPPNHLDLPPEALPTNGKAMKSLLDQRSRWQSSTLPASSPRLDADADRR